jgi:hypothetical protein
VKPHSSVLKYPGGEAKPRGQSPLTTVQKVRGGPISRILSKAPILRPTPLDDHSSATSVTRCSQAANPGLWAEASLWRSLLLSPAFTFDGRRPFHTRPLFGVAPGGACRAGSVTSPAVGFYPTVSPVPCQAEGEPSQTAGKSVLCGAFPGVAPAGCYPAPLLHGVRTFLGSVAPPRSSSHPREGRFIGLLKAGQPATVQGLGQGPDRSCPSVHWPKA